MTTTIKMNTWYRIYRSAEYFTGEQGEDFVYRMNWDGMTSETVEETIKRYKDEGIFLRVEEVI